MDDEGVCEKEVVREKQREGESGRECHVHNTNTKHTHNVGRRDEVARGGTNEEYTHIHTHGDTRTDTHTESVSSPDSFGRNRGESLAKFFQGVFLKHADFLRKM